MKLITFLSLALFSCFQTQAADKPAQKFQAGIHFEVLSPGIDLENNKPVVYEFFGYTCPGCAAMQPIVNALEEEVAFDLVRVPVVFHDTWEPYARTYHTLSLMNLTDTTHQAIFNAFHVNNNKMRNIEAIAKWLSSAFNVDQKEFLALSQSFAVDGKMRQAERLRQSLNINNTPTLIVNGQYKPNIPKLAEKSKIIAATQYLLQK